MKKAKDTVAAERRAVAGRKEGSYPQTTLRKCINFAEAVKSYGGAKADVNKSLIGSHLKLSESSLSVMLASSKCFGIIEGNNEYRLTENGKNYFFPASDGERRQAELNFLASPAAFKFIIGRFDGDRLPVMDMLANLLVREALAPQSWSVRVASFFTSSASELGLIDGSGFLRYRAAIHSLAHTTPVEQPASDNQLSNGERRDKAPPPATIQNNAATSPDMNVWVYSEAGATVRLETPDPLPQALLERLRRYVDLLGPVEPGKRRLK